MTDSVTSYSRSSWFARIKNAVLGVLLGLLMVPGSVLLMSWNEYRTVHRTAGLKEGAKTVATVADPATVRDDLEGRLVHMTGFADTEEILRDSQFRIAENAIALRRSVEMYQWVETKETESESNAGGSKTTKTTYHYDLEWVSGREDSDHFQEKVGHENPIERFREKTKMASLVNVGAYELDEELISQVDSYEVLPWDDAAIAKMSLHLRTQFQAEGDFLYWSINGSQGAASPDVGDQRVRMEIVKPTDVSLVAQQNGNSFSTFKVSNGEAIQRLYVGKFSEDEMFEKLQEENMLMAWIIRAGGLIVCILGFLFILGPLSVFADVIPILGSLTRGFAGFAALLLGLGVSAVTIAMAWIAVRPLLAIPLLVLAFAAVALLFRTWLNKRRGGDDQPSPYQNLATS